MCVRAVGFHANTDASVFWLWTIEMTTAVFLLSQDSAPLKRAVGTPQPGHATQDCRYVESMICLKCSAPLVDDAGDAFCCCLTISFVLKQRQREVSQGDCLSEEGLCSFISLARSSNLLSNFSFVHRF